MKIVHRGKTLRIDPQKFQPKPRERSTYAVDFGARYITLKGAWDVEVLQEDGYWPPSAIVQASRTAPRDPLVGERQTVQHTTLAPLTPHYYKPNGELVVYILCPACGDFQAPDAFSNDANRPNGKRGYCKSCESAKSSARYYRRKRAA